MNNNTKEKGQSDRARDRAAKRHERKVRGRNSKWDAGHGKGGALSERGFIESLPSQDLASAAAAAPTVELELKKSHIRAVYEEFKDVFEVLSISLAQITDQEIAVRGQWLTDAFKVSSDAFFSEEMQFAKIDSNSSLRKVLKDLKSKLEAEGYLECSEEKVAAL